MRFWYLIFSFLLVSSIPPKRDANLFAVNLVNLSSKTKDIDEASAHRFLSIINNGFKDPSGNPVVQFYLKSFENSSSKASHCIKLISLGDQLNKPSKEEVLNAYEECKDKNLADPKAINVYLFNSSWDDNEERKSSRIFFNNFKPFVFMNVGRLENDWNVWVHEFGHVFGLFEYSACDSNAATPTNPMGHESDFCEGTGGNRELPFEPWQFAIIRLSSEILAFKLK